jgi:hypothetical protein
MDFSDLLAHPDYSDPMSAYNLRRIAPEVGATLAVAPMPPRLAAPPAPSALPGLAWPASAAAPVANFLSEAEQIRMGLGLLSAVWFAFFAVAESRLTNVEQQAEVAYLVASASLGFAWTGPLTVLAGMRMYPRTYLLWQPFVGGYSFVLLQAFGWLLYSATLMFCLLALANLGSSGHGRALSEGSLLVLGVLGVAAGVLLNFSLDSFDEAMCTRPAPATKPPAAGAAAETPAPVARPRGAPRVGVLATGKTLVAALLSAFGLCLFLICDQYRARLPFGSLPIASLSFVGAAVVTQCVNGPTVLPGYRAFQPFEGGMSFVILQASSWLALGGVLQAVLLVPSDRISELSGVLPTMGLSGLGSQLILLSSLLHYEPCAPRPAGAVAAARSRRLRALASSEAFLSLCFYVWAAVSFVCGYALERGVLVRWPIPMDMRSLWMLSLLLLAIATPCAHFAGERLHCGYRAWQPFRGGTMFCVAQGFGWMLYGVFYLSLLVHARRARVRGETYSTSDVVVFAFGSLAYAMVSGARAGAVLSGGLRAEGAWRVLWSRAKPCAAGLSLSLLLREREQERGRERLVAPRRAHARSLAACTPTRPARHAPVSPAPLPRLVSALRPLLPRSPFRSISLTPPPRPRRKRTPSSKPK